MVQSSSGPYEETKMVILRLPAGVLPDSVQQVVQCSARDDEDRHYPFTPICVSFVDQWHVRTQATVYLSVEAAKDLRSQLDTLLRGE